MSKFITGKDLESAVYDIIWEAESQLLIVSPFIKLDNYFKELFDRHEKNPKIHLILVFGKNEKAVKRSMSEADFDYFKKFPNVSIIYVPNLHAKYYGNEQQGVITSINLYDYSFKNNIEFGVFAQQSILDRFKSSADNEAWNECMHIAHQGEVVFIKRPVFETKKVIISFGKNYVHSDVLFDSTDKFYGQAKSRKEENKKLEDFPEEIELGSKNETRPQRAEEEVQQQGFCIRSGKKIKFNPKQPMSKEAWKIWNEYGNEDFPEKYCHKTGNPSNGKTSMRNPIL
ncbi:MAG: phospholipase D family protein [Flavobacteriales bacterium]|nr:phospholipase D family protein [Flavobacteriales bacterium]MDG1765513.1 phospholipase D family protein [Flavobacteriales bacterium]